jgi:hypothetical protein
VPDRAIGVGELRPTPDPPLPTGCKGASGPRGWEKTIQRADTIPRVRAFPPEALRAVTALLDALLDARVAFCSWKSNEHLGAGLAGETDLDLLVERSHAGAFRAIVAGQSIKSLTPPRDGRHPATEHFLGFDDATGRLFHVHVQYELVLGEKYIKNYTLPLTRRLLDSATLVEGVPVPAPELELAILATRSLLKYRLRDAVKDVSGVRTPGIPAETRAELAWLRRRTTVADVRTELEVRGCPLPAGPICAFLEAVDRAPRPGLELIRLRAELRHALRGFRRRGRVRASLAYGRGAWLRRRRFRIMPADLRMLPVAGGTAVALVGSDGSGKSTMSRAIEQWLGWKVQTRVYYMGSKAPSRRSRALYLTFRALRRTHRAWSERLDDRRQITTPVAAARDTVRALHSLSIARDRGRRYQQAQRDARDGRVVIFDRFPLASLDVTEAQRLFDGPEIPDVLPAPMGPVPRALAAAEARLYRRFRLPEHLVMLRVDLDTAIDRKPDHPPEVLLAKCTAFDALTERVRTLTEVDVSHVDANQPPDMVLSDLKQAVWHVL